MSEVWDVIVVGGGTGGALAARKCAAHGLKTLLLEKKKMPRDKCCSGMVMGEWGQDIVAGEFGEYPDEVLREATDLSGYAFHVPGVPVQLLDIKTPAMWRKVLDTWMCHKAEEAGATIWDAVRVMDVTEKAGKNILLVEKEGLSSELAAEFVVGADGANSRVRRALFSDLKPLLLAGYRECYKVKLDLPEKRFNIFTSLGTDPLFFVHDKKEYMLLEGVAVKGRLKETIVRARQILIDSYGFDPHAEPVWRDGCVEPVMYRELSNRSFRPARGNVLIIGDAAGLNIPVTGEGISTSLWSGREAAGAIIKAKESNKQAGGIYLKAVDELLVKFKDINAFGHRIKTAVINKDPRDFSDATLQSWDYALKMF